jgi:hypothetical protein
VYRLALERSMALLFSGEGKMNFETGRVKIREGGARIKGGMN